MEVMEMKNKEILKDIEGNWNYEKCVKPEDVEWLIEQTRKFTKMEFIYEKGGGARQNHADDVDFGGDSKCGVCNFQVDLRNECISRRESDRRTFYHLSCEGKSKGIKPCSDCGLHRLKCDECVELSES